MPTVRPAPRWPILGSRLFSMIRTGMPFFSKVRANISPEGPEPTYTSNVGGKKLVVIEQRQRTIRTWAVIANSH